MRVVSVELSCPPTGNITVTRQSDGLIAVSSADPDDPHFVSVSPEHWQDVLAAIQWIMSHAAHS